jgi:CheY-like chemotaxis protein
MLPIETASILVTDDDADFRSAICNVLSPRFHTLQAASGEEAVRIVLTQPIHLLMLDMHMPKWTGLETLRRVKKFRQELPCILLSAALDEHMKHQAELAAAFSVLAKPVSVDVLNSTIDRAFRLAYASWYQDGASGS